MNASPRELHKPTAEETQAAIETLLRLNAMDGEGMHALKQRMEAEATDWRDHALGCLRRVRQYRAWAADYPAGSDRHQRYSRMAADQWANAKFAARKHRENLSWR